MKTILVFAAMTVVACAGEWGLRLESPRDTLGWVSQTWEIAGLTASARGEAQLLPLAFQRLVLGLSASGGISTWKLEGTLLSSGRLDFFLSASSSLGFTLGAATAQLALGGKWGWAALNFSPLWIGTFWALVEIEGTNWKGKVQGEWPAATLALRVESGGFALSLGNTVILAVSEEKGDWGLGAQIQIVPKRQQKLMLSWTNSSGTAQAWLSLEGGGLMLTEKAEPWNIMFFLLFGQNTQGILELTYTF